MNNHPVPDGLFVGTRVALAVTLPVFITVVIRGTLPLWIVSSSFAVTVMLLVIALWCEDQLRRPPNL